MDKVFKGFIKQDVKVYVDDMVVKYVSNEWHVEGLSEILLCLY